MFLFCRVRSPLCRVELRIRTPREFSDRTVRNFFLFSLFAQAEIETEHWLKCFCFAVFEVPYAGWSYGFEHRANFQIGPSGTSFYFPSLRRPKSKLNIG